MSNKVDYVFAYDRFGEKVKARRWGRGLTQTELGELINRKKSTISKIESGKVIPKISEFLALCCLFDLSPSEFLITNEDFQGVAKYLDTLAPGYATAYMFDKENE